MIRVLLAVIVVLVAALWVQGVRAAHARTSALRTSLALDSAESARDTTRELGVAALHDSVRVFVKRAAQQQQRADNLDRAVSGQRLARLNAQLRVAALDTVVRTDTVTVTSTGRRRFAVRKAPYGVVGEIAPADSTGDQAVSLQIDLDSIPLDVRLSCERERGAAVNKALVVAVAPQWARVRLDAVEQSPLVCNPGLQPASARSRLASLAQRLGISVGAAVTLERDGKIFVRPALLLGVRAWP